MEYIKNFSLLVVVGLLASCDQSKVACNLENQSCGQEIEEVEAVETLETVETSEIVEPPVSVETSVHDESPEIDETPVVIEPPVIVVPSVVDETPEIIEPPVTAAPRTNVVPPVVDETPEIVEPPIVDETPEPLPGGNIDNESSNPNGSGTQSAGPFIEEVDTETDISGTWLSPCEPYLHIEKSSESIEELFFKQSTITFQNNQITTTSETYLDNFCSIPYTSPYTDTVNYWTIPNTSAVNISAYLESNFTFETFRYGDQFFTSNGVTAFNIDMAAQTGEIAQNIFTLTDGGSTLYFGKDADKFFYGCLLSQQANNNPSQESNFVSVSTETATVEVGTGFSVIVLDPPTEESDPDTIVTVDPNVSPYPYPPAPYAPTEESDPSESSDDGREMEAESGVVGAFVDPSLNDGGSVFGPSLAPGEIVIPVGCERPTELDYYRAFHRID